MPFRVGRGIALCYLSASRFARAETWCGWHRRFLLLKCLDLLSAVCLGFQCRGILQLKRVRSTPRRRWIHHSRPPWWNRHCLNLHCPWTRRRGTLALAIRTRHSVFTENAEVEAFLRFTAFAFGAPRHLDLPYTIACSKDCRTSGPSSQVGNSLAATINRLASDPTLP